MNYLLINRDNVVLDVIPDRIRYTKLVPSTGLVIGCEGYEGTGVIGSDANTGYTLIRSDTNNNPNAVSVLELEEVPSNVIAGKTVFDPETNSFKPRYTLEEVQMMKQEENKANFAAYLASHPLTWVDEKIYGVTEQDQAEISLNINQYQIAVAAGVEAPTLEWHASHEECTPWTMEQLVALSLQISAYVYPIYHKMQEFKTRIFGSTTEEEVEAIECIFEEKTEQEPDNTEDMEESV